MRYYPCAATWLSLSVLSEQSASAQDSPRRSRSVSRQTLSAEMMDDRQQIYALYERMYKAMIAKDADVLRLILPEGIQVHTLPAGAVIMAKDRRLGVRS